MLGAGESGAYLEHVLITTAAAQMLHGGAVKGGTGITIRVGTGASRQSWDLDVSLPRGITPSTYTSALSENLSRGWGLFTGSVHERVHEGPVGLVPDNYVMNAYTIRVRYGGVYVGSVDLELVLDEIGCTTSPDYLVHPSITELFLECGLEVPRRVALVGVVHQMAQKLHGCTTVGLGGGNSRARDLVDLQVLYATDEADLTELRRACVRLFALRKWGTWPPVLRTFDGWEEEYEEGARGLGVHGLYEALLWGTMLVGMIEDAR
jgi:hypothetical protein